MSRIIAGRARGRRLETPAHHRTRPTSDRVREAVFSSLVSWADGQGLAAEDSLRTFSFLDLYAGSGAVALEAASRGAGPVAAVESDRRTADLVARNASALQLDVSVQQGKVETVVGGPAARAYDIVWADPPYEVESAAVDRVVARLLDNGWLAEHGLVVLERSSRTPAPAWPARLGDAWDRRYGETTVYFAQEATS